MAEPGQTSADCLSFLENISWSTSIVFIFPFVAALTLKYDLAIPELFEFLRQKAQGEEASGARFDDFNAWLDRRCNSRWVTTAALALTLVLNFICFFQILDHQRFPGWMPTGSMLGAIAPPGGV